MANFEATSKYKLIYIFEIHDESHKGLLKIGEATIASSDPSVLAPNCNALNTVAKARIKSYTETAGISYTLRHTELAIREVCFGSRIVLAPFSDKDVHTVLLNSGKRRVQPNATSGKEWFEVDLETAKNAIKAVKEGRKSLSSNEITCHEPPIVLREEQTDAIEKTLERFKKHKEMLWYAKMRFGKTLTSLEVIRRGQFRRVIIVTHRPVVGSGWQEDFYKIFRKGEEQHNYSFEFKKTGNSDSEDMHIDRENEVHIRNLDQNNCFFVYFASIQDLRGSQRVGGKHNKNNAIFDLDWDLIIIDEAHEGTQTELGDTVVKVLRKSETKVLALSGTPFNILDQYEDESVYTWDYVMEQKRKEEWDLLHPGDHNPYADLPQMHIFTYNLGENIPGYVEHELEGKAFNFREFFRTYTGDEKIDRVKMPVGKSAGDFIHEADVSSFLGLITKPNKDSLYPFSTQEYREMFKHTLWMVPGVKEAKALSKLLRKHPVFKNFGIANVAGEGDDFEREHSDDALALVRNTIRDFDYSITLSCGKLTTGVTVKEWTAVFMLAGSYSTAAAGYMQTIFRVQSAGQVDGKQKTDCYVFDFAPDRTLKVLAETANISHKAGRAGKRQDQHRDAMSAFINFCPVIAIEGTQMKPYSVNTMMEQLKRVYAEKAIRNGFDDASIYNDNLMRLNDIDLEKFKALRGIIGSTKAAPPLNDVEINAQGFSEEEHEKAKAAGKKPKRERTPEEEELLKKLQEQKKNRNNAISILRGVSIRMPLLIYGADVPFDEDISIEKFVDLVDPESWQEFMPKGVTKKIFADFLKYYDRDVFIAAGKEIRKLAASSDILTPTERVVAISKIFRYFKNPDKETVLTPWRVVNMHMSDCLGGWCFYDGAFETMLEEPRFVDRGRVTREVLCNPHAQILEINSKSGLYPLYITYSVYRTKLGSRLEEETSLEELNSLWQEAVSENVYVICKTPMAKSITRRTLLGYQPASYNAHYFDNLINMLKNKPEQFKKRILKGSYWKKEVKEMKFDAIVGNPPYQAQMGGVSSIAIYPEFVQQSISISPKYCSMITPSRWMTATSGSLVAYRDTMLRDRRVSKLFDFQNANDCFPLVEIKGGVSYFLWDSLHEGNCAVTTDDGNGKTTTTVRPLVEEGMETFVRNGELISLLYKVKSFDETSFSSIVSANDPFGFDTREEHSSKRKKVLFSLVKSERSIPFYYNGWRNDGIGYVKGDTVKRNQELVNKYKIFIPKAWGVGNPSKDWLNPFIPEDNAVCTETYLMVGPFETIDEANNCVSYIRTKFFHTMVSFIKSTQNTMQKAYSAVPLQDFTQEWTDEKLYAKYGLSQEEIEYIESTIRSQ